jgi:transposase
MYPGDRRVLALHVYGLLHSLRKTARLVLVSHSTIARWLRNPKPKGYCRTTPTKSQAVSESIRAAVQSDPLASVRTIRDRILEVLGMAVSCGLIRVALKRLGYSRKKARFCGPKLPNTQHERKTREFIQARKEFVEQERTFVSIDETSFGRHTPAIMGYSMRGTPLYVGKVKPRVTTTSVLACVSREGLVKRQSIRGSFNTLSFVAFLQDLDVPPRTVLLLDNVAFHHSKAVKALATSRGWDLLYVPPYSPWYNPIEFCFSIVKRAFYKGGSPDEAFEKLQPRHCWAFFTKSLSLEGPCGVVTGNESIPHVDRSVDVSRIEIENGTFLPFKDTTSL